MTSLKRRVAAGAAWLVLFRLVERGIGLVSTLILARLLLPEDFGLIAMATSILAALELLGAFSFDLALIQNQQAGREHYDTAWTFNVAFGAAKAVGMCVLAYPAALFFGEPRITPVMLVLAVGVLLQGFENVGVVAFQKDLELHKEFQLGLWKKLAGFVVTVAVAYVFRSHWALVAGTVVFRAAGLLLSYALHPYRPRLSLARAGELFGYSKWLLLNNVLIFLNNRGADFMVGRIAGATALGTYSVAYELANLPTTELVWPITRAVFPGYSRLAHDRALLREAFLQVTGLMALVTVPAGAAIGLLAEPIVRLLLGPKWIAAAPLIQTLAVFGIIRAIHGPTGAVYLAIGKPRLIAGLQIVQLVIAFGLMAWWLPTLGALGAAYSVCIAASTAMCVNFAMILRDIALNLRGLLESLWRPLVAMAAVALCAPYAASTGESPASSPMLLTRLVSDFTIGVLIYLVVVAVLWRLVGRPRGAETAAIELARRRLARNTSA